MNLIGNVGFLKNSVILDPIILEYWGKQESVDYVS